MTLPFPSRYIRFSFILSLFLFCLLCIYVFEQHFISFESSQVSKLSAHPMGSQALEAIPSPKVRNVAGCIVTNALGTHVLLVTSRSHLGQWILPKGGYKDPNRSNNDLDSDDGADSTIQQAAARETEEEAGVKLHLPDLQFVINNAPLAKNGKKLDDKTKRHRKKRQEIFYWYWTKTILEELPNEKWKESAQRERRWFPFHVVPQYLDHKQHMLEAFNHAVEEFVRKDSLNTSVWKTIIPTHPL